MKKKEHVLNAYCLPLTINKVVKVLDDPEHYNYSIVYQYTQKLLSEGKIIKFTPEKIRNAEYISVELFLLSRISDLFKEFNQTLKNLEKEELNLQKKNIDVKNIMLKLQKFITQIINLSNAPDYDLSEKIKSLTPGMEDALKLINAKYGIKKDFDIFI